MNGRWVRRLAFAAVALVAATEPVMGAEAPDTTGTAYFAPSGGLGRIGVTPYGDARARGEVVRGRPGATDDLSLARASVRAGLVWAPPGAPARAEAGIRLIAGDEAPGDPWTGVLNEPARSLAVDRLGVRLFSAAGTYSLAAGKQRSPFRLTEMIWDDDLRPVGAALAVRRALSDEFATRATLALLTRSRADADDARLAGVQLAAALREDAAAGADAALAWLRFAGPENLARDALARQNATTASASGAAAYASDFEVFDLQLGVRAAAGAVPVSLRLDLARNVAIARDRESLRLRVALGGAGVPAEAEAGWVFQRVEREALPGAFNSDDWWFHSRMRGHQVWLRAGFAGRFEARLAGFHERRDDVARPTRRLSLQLSARLPTP